MNITREYLRWSDANNSRDNIGTYEAFKAGAEAGIRLQREQEEAAEKPFNGQKQVFTYSPPEPVLKDAGVTSIISDRVLAAMRLDSEYFIKNSSGRMAYGPYDVRRLLNTIDHYRKLARPEVTKDMAPKPVILDTQVLRADTNGCIVLSDADVDRIAKATVTHAVKVEAARQRAAKASCYADGTTGPRATPFSAYAKAVSNSRVDTALRDAESQIDKIQNAAHVRFNVVVALKHLVSAIKILKERT